ncbi:cadherin-1-like [Takifugu rubripes]|uniref:cadherin-1-like n=1 Tax=Takifugu rubripes TaxID=31033 RepID=UPI0011458ED1|nr:cadherin-1-like [Takifugu rubripes]
MGVAGVRIWVFLFVAYQVSTLVTPEEQTCVPGFDQDNVIFKMTSKNLRSHARLGKVNFDDCTMRRRFTFWSSDSRVRVQTDGTLTVKRPITLHEGHLDFLIDIRDSQGHKHTLPVRLLHQSLESEVNNSEGAMEAPVPVLYFQRSGGGLRRRKRDWVIPPSRLLRIREDPTHLKSLRSVQNQDKLKKISTASLVQELISLLQTCSPWTETQDLCLSHNSWTERNKPTTRWWVHWGRECPHSRFGLGLAVPHGRRPQPPGARDQAPAPGLAPGWGPGNPPGWVRGFSLFCCMLELRRSSGSRWDPPRVS